MNPPHESRADDGSANQRHESCPSLEYKRYRSSMGWIIAPAQQSVNRVQPLRCDLLASSAVKKTRKA